jgi:galactonate dehydratase
VTGGADDGVAIRGVETVVVNAELRNWVFVKVLTSEPDLVGWGEATLEWRAQAVVGAVGDIAPLLVGEDPLRIEHLWQVMYRQHFFRGGAVTMSAISGIDMALHDIAGKVRGVPTYQLLGGAVRDHVRFYDHLGGGDSNAVYGVTADAPAQFGELAARSVADGFDALKILAVPPSRMLDGQAAVRLAARRIEAVRDAVGPDVDVMVDLHGRTTPAMAIQYGHAMAASAPWFLEEPCPPENVEALAEVARALPIPIATGERLGTRHDFRPVLEQRACAVIQPDVCHCGGLTELRKIAAMADAYYVSVAPHNPLGPIATMASLQFAFATPNFLIQEVMRADVPWRDEVVDCPLAIRDGRAQPPTRPGLGIAVDEREAAKHPYRPERELRVFHEDGSVGDW